MRACFFIGAFLFSLLAVSVAHAAPVTFIEFDTDYQDGWRIEDEYAQQGVHFVNDYMTGKAFQASPTIRATASAWSSPNVLVNEATDEEIHSSSWVPLIILFDQPVDAIGFRPGYFVTAVSSGTVTLYDAAGVQRAFTSFTPTGNFSAGYQAFDPTSSTRMAVISYGSRNVEEAIDSLAFRPVTSAPQPIDQTPPVVQFTSHQNNQSVATNPILVKGTVSDNSLAIANFKINGGVVKLTPKIGPAGLTYEFEYFLTLIAGANPLTALAWDGSGNKGGANLTIHYGPPAGVSISQFHLTQRGIMQNQAVDIDSPLVAGKYTIVRVHLDARTASNEPTYVSALEMNLVRRVGGVDQPVDSFWGTLVNGFVSNFVSATEMSGVHFFIPGEKFDPPGEYTMRFQPYVGLNKVGPELPVPGAQPYLTFEDTKPLKLFIAPAETSIWNPQLGSQHGQDVATQLFTVTRAYPIRENGLKYVVGNPVVFCDGSQAMMNASTWCKGTGFEWTFKDTHASGVWRAGYAAVQNTQNVEIGGRVTTDTVLTPNPNHFRWLPDHLDPAGPFGIFYGGSTPGFGTFLIPFDDNHNDVIDLADLQHYVAQFYDNQTNAWSTNLQNYNLGETFRMYADQNNNNQHDGDEPVAPGVNLWHNANPMLLGPLGEALNEHNANMPGTANDLDYSALFFPNAFMPHNPPFGTYGPGSANGNRTWIRVTNDQTLAHELGHMTANLGDLYFPHITEAERLVPAWAAYIQNRSVTATGLYDIMHSSTNPDTRFFKKTNYQTVFDKFKTSGNPSPPMPLEAFTLLEVSGMAMAEVLTDVNVRVTSDTALTPASARSPYRLILGDSRQVLAEHRFPVDSVYHTFAGDFTGLIPGVFRVVVPYPAGLEWVEILHDDLVLIHIARSANPPSVTVTTPNGGEVFGADEDVAIAWQARDRDNDDLTFAILYTPDGTHWHPIAVGVKESQYLWNTGSVPGGRSCLIQVTASDGFNAASDRSDRGFTVGRKSPSVTVINPDSGRIFLECQPVPLLAWGIDPEDENLTYNWQIRRNMQAVASANGREAIVGPFEPGTYSARVEATDSDQNAVLASRLFYVIADSDKDGMSDAWEEQHGLDVSLAFDARDDLDGDGLVNFDEAWRDLDPRDSDTDDDGWSDEEEVRLGTDPKDRGRYPFQSTPAARWERYR